MFENIVVTCRTLYLQCVGHVEEDRHDHAVYFLQCVGHVEEDRHDHAVYYLQCVGHVEEDRHDHAVYYTFNVWDMLRRTGMTMLAVAELLAT
jgi:hypothetical protein